MIASAFRSYYIVGYVKILISFYQVLPMIYSISDR